MAFSKKPSSAGLLWLITDNLLQVTKAPLSQTKGKKKDFVDVSKNKTKMSCILTKLVIDNLVGYFDHEYDPIALKIDVQERKLCKRRKRWED